MKKKKDWTTKTKKRRIKKKDRGIVDLARTVSHFFKDLPQWINEMTDPRNLSYTVYTQSDLIFMGILKNICGVKTMRSMEEQFNEENCIDTLRILSGDRSLVEMPHSDTLNYYLEKLSPKCLAEVRKRMVNRLIRMKSFYGAKLFGKYWRVIIDGTGLFYFKEKHCENCLVETTTREENGKKVKGKRYYHKVLEAKLVLAPNIIISLDTEFIENEREDVEKNDCEINAAKRLLERLRKNYPKLPICLQGDALYAVEPMMGICRKNHWKYILTQKETRQKLLAENYAGIQKSGGAQTVEKIGKEKGTGEYINHVEAAAGKKETANMYQYRYETEGKNGELETHKFQCLTNIELTAGNLEEMIEAGRGRWKIENEGFNNQKNGIYDIEHLNSRDSNAMKNHYLITQIADIVMQLYLAWSPLIQEISQSIKNTSSWLLESFRHQTVTDEDVRYIQRYTTVYLE